MVQRLVDLLREERFAGVFSVELISLRLSDSLEEVGGFSWRKVWRTLGFLVRLLGARMRGPIDLLYYVPATGLRSQIYRDWVLLGWGRRLARRTALHWHGLGLKDFYQKSLSPVERWLTRRTYDGHSLSLVLADRHRGEVEWLHPKQVRVLPNFLADPCPSFDRKATGSKREGADLRVLFLGHCTRTKGLFDLLDGVALANAMLERRGDSWRVLLTVGGEFLSENERAEFANRIAAADLRMESGGSAVTLAGYLDGDQKHQALLDADALGLPTYFHTEAQPVVLIEALAYGLEIVVSDWRNLSAMLPETAQVVPVRFPEKIAEALIACARRGSAERHRAFFLEHYEQERIAKRLPSLMSVEGQPPA